MNNEIGNKGECCSGAAIGRHRINRDFPLYCCCLRIHHPAAVIINIAIILLIFKVAGIGAISILTAALFIVKEVGQYSLLVGMERRIMKPIVTLKLGVESIAKGDYSVRVKNDIHNEIGFLIDEFNKMAEKLQQSEKLKAEYEENRKSLIANISHDLKTPITAISGYMEAIIDGVVTERDKINKYLKTIQVNIAYMNNLIDDLFLFSRLDMQKLDFKFEEVNIVAFLKDAMEEFEFVLGEEGINCSYDNSIDSGAEKFEVAKTEERSDSVIARSAERGIEVNMDRKRIHQVIRNIIGNAVKHGRDNLSIKVELREERESIRINIIDNGPGIPEDKLPYVFERFYRIDTERTKDLMSTGLGLAIARELVEAHGGEIQVSSTPGEGSCFSILLPKARQEGMSR